MRAGRSVTRKVTESGLILGAKEIWLYGRANESSLRAGPGIRSSSHVAAAEAGQFSFPSFSIKKSNPICFQLNDFPLRRRGG